MGILKPITDNKQPATASAGRNLAVLLEYDGTDFCGYQYQPQVRTIQGELENALKRLFGRPFRVNASGRTDAGVHALGQVAGFILEHDIQVERLPLALNSVLPRDIVVKRAAEAKLSFHPRYSAVGKIYRYCIINRAQPSALLRNYTAFIPYKLDIDAMKRACSHLVGERNFASMMSSGSPVKSTVRNLRRLEVKCRSDGLLIFTAEANGFLYQMVRNIVGTLVDVGRGRLLPEEIPHILEAEDRKAAGPAAPPQGLYLQQVIYPEKIIRWCKDNA